MRTFPRPTFLTIAALGLASGCGDGLDTLKGDPKLTVLDGLKSWYCADSFGKKSGNVDAAWKAWKTVGTSMSLVGGMPWYSGLQGMITPYVSLGGGSYYQSSGTLSSSQTAFDIFVVASTWGTNSAFFGIASSSTILGSGCVSTKYWMQLGRNGVDQNVFDICRNGTLSSVPVDEFGSSWRIHQATYSSDSAAMKYWVNGSLGSIGLSGPVPLDGSYLIGQGENPGSSAQISEVLIYNRALSTEETEKVRKYLYERNRIPGP